MDMSCSECTSGVCHGSDFVSIDKMFYTGLQGCANTTYATTMRKPLRRILLHIESENIRFDEVEQWLSGALKPPLYDYGRQVTNVP
jgi:hypothetical protein